MNRGSVATAVAIGIITALTIHLTATGGFAAGYFKTDSDTVVVAAQADTALYVQTSSAVSARPALLRSTTHVAAPVIAASAAITARAHVVIPRGTMVSAKIVTPISSRTAKVGDRVEAITTEPIQAQDRVVIPAGATVIGHVSNVRAAVETRTAADLDVTFTSIGGHPIRTALVSPDLEARASAANRAVDVALVAGGALAGGVIGHQINHKRGSTIGAIGGAVLGGVAAANVGANVQLKAGEPATLRFEQDLAIE